MRAREKLAKERKSGEGKTLCVEVGIVGESEVEMDKIINCFLKNVKFWHLLYDPISPLRLNATLMMVAQNAKDWRFEVNSRFSGRKML